MRLVSAVLFVALTGSLAVADEAKPAEAQPQFNRGVRGRVPLRVVRMLPETRQVLLLDRNRGTHVVAEVGQEVDGYLVDDIAGDEVTLVSPNGTDVILAAPNPSWRRAPQRRPAPHREPQPIDPYAAPGSPDALDSEVGPVRGASASSAVADEPYEPGAGGVRVASAATASSAPGSDASWSAPTAAPIVDAGPPASTRAPSGGELDPGIAAFADAVGAEPAPSRSASTATSAASPPVSPPPPPAPAATDEASVLAAAVTGSPVPPPPARSGPAATPSAAAATFIVSRGEVDAALGNFAATAATFKAAFTAGGLRIDAIGDGTILARLGLRKGDVITAVDQQPLRSLDDAATLYARAGTARSATLSVVRAGKPVTLRVTIR